MRRPRLIIAIAVLLAAAALAAWELLPRSLPTPAVESARLLGPGEPDGSRRPAVAATPVRIAVTFSTPVDLAAARERARVSYVVARLFPCAGSEQLAAEVVTQDGGYLPDDGRTIRLAPGGRGARYRVVFDDRLSTRRDGDVVDVAATAAGPLCLALYGARMWWGSAASERVAVPPLR